MFCIKIADLVVAIDHRYPYVERFCREYTVPDGPADLTISVTPEEIERERGDQGFSDGYYESLAIYRKLCRAMLAYDGILMHAAVIAMDGKAYAFAARSGTGKTTHIRQWLTVFGDRVTVVNGDKPIIRRIDGAFYACGTPWRGKEGMGGSGVCPLQAICFVERGEENRIRRMTSSEAIPRLFQQLLLPKEEAEVTPYMALVDQLMKTTKLYLLTCRPDPEAAQVAYEGMVEGTC